MKTTSIALLVMLLAACHGEPIPRNYQNTPSQGPGADSPAEASRTDTQYQGAQEPSSGAEGTSAPYEQVPVTGTTSPAVGSPASEGAQSRSGGATSTSSTQP